MAAAERARRCDGDLMLDGQIVGAIAIDVAGSSETVKWRQLRLYDEPSLLGAWAVVVCQLFLVQSLTHDFGPKKNTEC